MSAFAMFSLKAPSLLAFDKQRAEGNLNTIYGIPHAPCDTRMRERLDPVSPESLRPSFKIVFRQLQRGKALEPLVFLNGHYPYNATFFSPLTLGASDARDTPGDCAVGPRPRRRGSPQSYTHAGVTRLQTTGGAATPSALALFFPKRPFTCHRKKCANIVSTIWCCQPAYFRTS